MKIPEVSTRPLQPDEWPVVENLFGKQGACGGCWCMWWRVAAGPKEWEKIKGEGNRESFRSLVAEGRVHAVLALVGDEPVGWCSFGPREDFARVARVKGLARDVPERTWSIICFYILAGRRRQGIARKLLAAATERAFDLGASEVEGYPVVPKSSPDRVPAAFASTGVPALFKAAGYRETSKLPSYYRLWLRAPGNRI